MDKAKYKQYVELIRSRLSDYRFYHSVCVAEAAVQLAERFGADVEQAYVAGILHDVMKEEEPSVQRAYIEKAGERMSDLEIRIGKVYHQMSGAAYARLELGITDPDILHAIRYHTTARRGMSLLEQIIYLADFISADRHYKDVETMRAKVDEGLEPGMFYALTYTLRTWPAGSAHSPGHGRRLQLGAGAPGIMQAAARSSAFAGTCIR